MNDLKTKLGDQELIADVSRWHLAINPHLAWWQIVAILLSMAALAWLIYRKEPLDLKRKRLLVILRSTSLAILAWMLWGWMIANEGLKLPQLWILVDRSESMQLPGANSKETRYQQAADRLQTGNLLKSLADRYETRFFAIGNGIQETTHEKLLSEQSLPIEPTSRLGEDLSALLATATGEPVAGIWALSDGRVTSGRGLDAALSTDHREIPVFVTPLGDQTPPLDIVLRDVRAPTSVIPGDEVEILVALSFPTQRGNEIKVELLDAQGDVLVQKSLEPTAFDHSAVTARANVALRTTLLHSGTHALEVRIPPLDDETSTNNNTMQLQVDVREEPLRVLLIANTPNYEFRFLKHLLERSTGPDINKPWLSLTSVLQEGDPRYADQDRSAVRLPPVDEAALDRFDVVVFIDANPDGLGTLLLERIAARIDERGTGLLVVAGPKHLPMGLRGTPMAKLMPIAVNESKPALSDMVGSWKLRLTPFGNVERAMELPDQAWELMPAVQFIVPRSMPAAAAQVLVEGISDQGEILPTIVSQRFGAGTIQLHLTDEMFRLVSTGTSDIPHEQFWLQSIRRLARGRQEAHPEFTQVRARPARAEADEVVHLDVQMSKELAAKLTGDVRVKLIEAKTGGERIVTLDPESDDRMHWQIDLEHLPAGTWEAELITPSSDARCPFEIQPVPTEMMRTDGDRLALEAIAKQSSGKVIEVTASASDVLRSLPATKPISRRAGETLPLWNHPLIVLLLCVLLVAEWGLRRWWNLV